MMITKKCQKRIIEFIKIRHNDTIDRKMKNHEHIDWNKVFKTADVLDKKIMSILNNGKKILKNFI